MSKKPSKKEKTKKAAPLDDPEPWFTELKTLNINDDQWQCNVTFLMETNLHNLSYVTAFNDMFSSGKNIRHHINIISNLSLAISVLESSYKFANQKSQTESAFKKLCNEALNYCATDGFKLNTPVRLLAPLIKYYLLDIKSKTCAETLLLQEYEKKKNRIKDESLLQVANIVKNTASSKKDKGKASAKKDKDKKSSKGKSAIEKFTSLRKRCEEFFDHNSVHDEGPNGPNLYIILSGFRQPDLPLELLKLQIPLIAVIKLNNIIDNSSTNICQRTDQLFSSALNLVCHQTKVTQRRYSNALEEFHLYDLSLKEFWIKLLLALNNKSNILLFKDTMFFKFYPCCDTMNLFNDANINKEKLGAELQKSIYEQLCFLQYDLQDLKRQHETYIKHLVIQDVKEKRNIDLDEMLLYSSIVDPVPTEIVNIPFILNAILLQVEHLVTNVTTEVRSSSVSEAERTLVKKNITDKESSLNSYIEALDRTYDLFYHDEILPIKKDCKPVVLVEGDEIGISSYGRDQNNSVKEITCYVLSCFWDNFFREHFPMYDDIFYSSRPDNDDEDLFKILKTTGDLTFSYKLSHLPCFYEKVLVEDKAYVFCCDDHSPELSSNEHLMSSSSSSEAGNNLPHYSKPSEGYFMGQIFDNHSYCFEEMTSDILLQNLFKCFEMFNCLDLQQDYFNDKLFLRFHNRMTCSNPEYLLGTLRTPTALRDFYDYTVDEEFYWLNEKELFYYKALLKKEKFEVQHELKQMQRLESKTHQRVNQICSRSNFFLPDSLKSKNELTPEKLSLESETSRTSDDHDTKCNGDKYLKAFDIDLPNRVQFSERRQEIVLSTNSKLLVKKLTRLYIDDAVFLQTTIYGHTLYFFRPVNKVSDIHFHVLHESGMIFYFTKNPINSDLLSNHMKEAFSNEIHEGNGLFYGGNEGENKVKSRDTMFKTVDYHLSLSLPSSLYLEIVNPQSIPLYIKQFYLSKIRLNAEIKDEEFRCSLLDGKLIKFMNDGSVIIYYPNSEIYYCKSISYQSTTVDGILSDLNVTNLKDQIPTAVKTKGKPQTPDNTEKVKKDDINVELPEPISKNVSTIINSFECTLTTGKRISVVGDVKTELEPLFCKSYTNVLKGIITTERYDGTSLIHNFEGQLIVNFPDGSRTTTFAEFAKDEVQISIDEGNNEEDSETNENNSKDNYSEFENNGVENCEELYVTNESDKVSFNNSPMFSDGFVVVEIHYLIEHPNFASIFVNAAAESLCIDLPGNAQISLKPPNLYVVNFDNKAELIVQRDEIVFREVNEEFLPEYRIHLKNDSEERSENDLTDLPNDNNLEGLNLPIEFNSSGFNTIFTCKDLFGNKLKVDSMGDIHIGRGELIENICQCSALNNNRVFIVNNQFNGIEIFSPGTLDAWTKVAENNKNCVLHNYASGDHHLLLLIKPLLQNEDETWLKSFQEIKCFPVFLAPSTYNDKHTHFNPFPKLNTIFKSEIPKAFIVRTINRINCNIHLRKDTFLKNKSEADVLRVNKCADLCVELYEHGKVEFCKADKAFIEYIRSDIIGRILSRVRLRVIKRLQYRKTKEYEVTLRERILLPYFDSCHGAVHVIILGILGSAVDGSLVVKEGSLLERLLKLPLDHLTDADLDFMHDKIAQFTVGNVCNCTTNGEACRLRILLLSGRILHGLIPDMITVFFLYADNMKRKRLAVDEKRQEESNLLKELLKRPLHLLTEKDFEIVHDRLKNTQYCTCSVSSEKCKMKILLLASAVLNDYYPNLDSLFQSSYFNLP